MRCTIFELLFIADIATSFIFHFYTFSHEGQCFDIFPFCYSFFRYFSLSTFFPFDVFSFDIFTLFFSLSTFFLSTFLLHTVSPCIRLKTVKNDWKIECLIVYGTVKYDRDTVTTKPATFDVKRSFTVGSF